MIPYGNNNPDTQLFPTPEEEQPAGSYQVSPSILLDLTGRHSLSVYGSVELR